MIATQRLFSQLGSSLRGPAAFAQMDESNGDATVWRTSFDGVLASTVRFTGGVVERVPNEGFKSGFDTEKLILTTRMRQ
jgi:hypothetical protein